MNIQLNGRSHSLTEAISLAQLLKQKAINPLRVVAELNKIIVRPEQFSTVILEDNDQLELIRFVGGG